MGRAVLGQDVVYFLPAGSPNAGAPRLAKIVRIRRAGADAGRDDTEATLYVYGFPADGPAFAGGPAYVDNVPRAEHARAPGTYSVTP